MKQKVTKYLIAMALALMPMLVSAQATKYTDTATKLTYTLNGNNATIVGGPTGTPLTGVLKIPATVSNNGANNGTVVSISTLVDDMVFSSDGALINTNGIYNNEAITAVDFSAVATQLTSIGDYTFYGCQSLTGNSNLSILTKLTSIGDHAFDGAHLEGILLLPTSLTSIGIMAFAGDDITGLVVNQNLNHLGNGAFSACMELAGTVDFSKNYLLTELPDQIFMACISLKEVKFPPMLTTIGDQAFFSCLALDNQTGDLDLSGLPLLASIGKRAFYYCQGFYGLLKFPTSGSLTSIGTGAFAMDTGFKNDGLVIPASVKTLSGTDYSTFQGAFFGCTGLTGDMIVEGITTLFPHTFNMCTGLRSITFKSPTIILNGDITKAVDGSFSECTNLEYVDMSACYLMGGLPSTFVKATPRSTASVFGGCPSHTLIYMPQGMPQFEPIEPNFIGSDVWDCNWFSVTDQADYFIPHGFSPTKTTYDNYTKDAYAITAPNYRVFNNSITGPDDKYSDFCTLYLPYDFTLPAGMVAYKLKSYADYSPSYDGPSLLFQSVGKMLQAYTPYIARFENTTVSSASLSDVMGVTIDASPVGMNHVIDGVTIPSPIEVASSQVTTDGGWMFYGSTENVDNATAESWNAYNLMTDMGWHPINSGDNRGYIGHMRGFITSKGASSFAKVMIAGIPGLGETAGINDIFGGNEPANSVETRVYSVSGQYMGKDFESLPKGLYIVNGKKVIK